MPPLFGEKVTTKIPKNDQKKEAYRVLKWVSKNRKIEIAGLRHFLAEIGFRLTFVLVFL